MQVDDNMHPLMMMCRKVKCDVFEDKGAIHSDQEPFGAYGTGLVGVFFGWATRRGLGMVDHPLQGGVRKRLRGFLSLCLSLFI
jgi:hypothetical protein